MATSKLLWILATLLAPLEPLAGVFASAEPAPVEQRQRGAVASVQIELLPDLDGAERLAAQVRERLAGVGLVHAVRVEAVVDEPELPISYRVVVGPFFEFEDAERARTELDELGVDGFVREVEAVIGC